MMCRTKMWSRMRNTFLRTSHKIQKQMMEMSQRIYPRYRSSFSSTPIYYDQQRSYFAVHCIWLWYTISLTVIIHEIFYHWALWLLYLCRWLRPHYRNESVIRRKFLDLGRFIKKFYDWKLLGFRAFPSTAESKVSGLIYCVVLARDCWDRLSRFLTIFFVMSVLHILTWYLLSIIVVAVVLTSGLNFGTQAAFFC